MLQNLLKVFNGYWRMDFPDWGLIHVGDLSSRRIIQQLKFLPSSSYLFFSSSKNPAGSFSDKISFPTWWWLHPGIFSRRRHFYDLMDHLWPGSWLFCLSTVSTHLFQLKATVLTIFLRVVKRNILFFPLDSKNRRFTRLQRGLFFGGDFWECRNSSFFEKISKVWNWWIWADSLNQLTSP